MIPLNESQPELQKELQAWQQVSRKIISRIERELFREPQVAIVICPESHSCEVRLCPHKTPHTLCLSYLNQPNHVCPNCVHSFLVIVTEERELANPLPEKFPRLMNITNPQQIFDRQRESEKFKALSPQQRLDYLRSRHGQIELNVISYQDSEGLGLISSWLVKDGRCCPLDGSLTNFPHYTVAVLDEKIL